MLKKAVILLSGGLDSVVSLAYLKGKYDIKLALTFDYGQRAGESEIKAAKKVAEFYNVEHKVIELPWLSDVTNTALVNKKMELPSLVELDDLKEAFKTAKSVWVPNRNGVFLNIAAAYCDSFGYDYIIFGANKEEGATFPDNTQEFIDAINKSFEYSTQVQPKVIAPMINFDKVGIVGIGADLDLPFELIRSCYTNNKKHCGKCESCQRFKRALSESSNDKILERLF